MVRLWCDVIVESLEASPGLCDGWSDVDWGKKESMETSVSQFNGIHKRNPQGSCCPVSGGARGTICKQNKMSYEPFNQRKSQSMIEGVIKFQKSDVGSLKSLQVMVLQLVELCILICSIFA